MHQTWHCHEGVEHAHVFSLLPLTGKVRVGVHSLQVVLVQALLAARPHAVSMPASQIGMVAVEFQIVASTVRRGFKPCKLLLDLLVDWWRQLAVAFDLEREARLYSGPHLVPLGATCEQVAAGESARRFLRRSGELLLSIHPAYGAGGSEEENKQWVMSRLATLCLSQGIELQVRSEFVDNVVAAVGPGKLTSLLSAPTYVKRWEAVTTLAKSKDILAPAQTGKHVKVEQRTKRALQKVKTAQQVMRAADVQLEPGFFVNEDGSPTPTLEAVTPGPDCSRTEQPTLLPPSGLLALGPSSGSEVDCLPQSLRRTRILRMACNCVTLEDGPGFLDHPHMCSPDEASSCAPPPHFLHPSRRLSLQRPEPAGLSKHRRPCRRLMTLARPLSRPCLSAIALALLFVSAAGHAFQLLVINLGLLCLLQQVLHSLHECGHMADLALDVGHVCFQTLPLVLQVAVTKKLHLQQNVQERVHLQKLREGRMLSVLGPFFNPVLHGLQVMLALLDELVDLLGDIRHRGTLRITTAQEELDCMQPLFKRGQESRVLIQVLTSRGFVWFVNIPSQKGGQQFAGSLMASWTDSRHGHTTNLATT